MDTLPMPQVRRKRAYKTFGMPDMRKGDWVLYGLTLLLGYWFVVELVTRY